MKTLRLRIETRFEDIGKIAEEIVDRKLYKSIKDNEIDRDIMKDISDEMFNNWINDTKSADEEENNCTHFQ